MMKITANLLCLFVCTSGLAVAQQPGAFAIARLKYAGGGDWYNDPSAEVNLLQFVQKTTGMITDARYHAADLAKDEIFAYPFLFVTGHGNIILTDAEVHRLRTYLENGGFLYVDDDYGLDKSFRREIRKVFPEQDLVELPFSYGLYHCQFDFPAGPPKTHEHNNKPPQGFGIVVRGRLVVYYTFESNPSDGWTDPEVHHDPPEKREEALRFGTNLVVWAMTH
jgi:hypothetical protein